MTVTSRDAAAWVIVVVWAVMYVRRAEDPSFPVPAEITPVMLAAAAYLFGKDIHDRISGRSRDPDA